MSGYWKENIQAIIRDEADPGSLASWDEETKSYYFPNDDHQYDGNDLDRIYTEWMHWRNTPTVEKGNLPQEEPIEFNPDQLLIDNYTRSDYSLPESLKNMPLIGKKIPLLDQGFVQLIDVMPYPASGISGDRAIADAARTSFGGESKGAEADARLIRRLWKDQHVSPFQMCLDGDTEIPTFRKGAAMQTIYTIRQLADAFSNKGRENAWVKLVNIRTVDKDGIVRPTKIKHASFTGYRECFRITEDSPMDRSIVATGNHPFLLSDGTYRQVSDLRVGDEIVINGTVPDEVVLWDDHKTMSQIGEILGVSETTIFKRLRKYGINTSRRSGFSRKEIGEHSRPHAIARRMKHGDICEICGRPSDEIHHKDENPHNNVLENLINVCRNCHKSFHNPALPKITYTRRIKSIESVGVRPVYDLEVVNENHNFVAGRGFVVHNCHFKLLVYAPLVTYWQWVRHRTFAFQNINSQSGRYTPFEEDVMYLPSEWRRQSSSNKMGSDGLVSGVYGKTLTLALADTYATAFKRYQMALEMGVSKELARLFLPGFSMYYQWVIEVDALNLMNFLRLRMAPDAQHEIRVYADAIYYEFFKPFLPAVAAAFEEFTLQPAGIEIKGE